MISAVQWFGDFLTPSYIASNQIKYALLLFFTVGAIRLFGKRASNHHFHPLPSFFWTAQGVKHSLSDGPSFLLGGN